MGAQSSSDRLLILILGLTVVLLLGNLAAFFGYVVDDVFISLRYAENWVRGLGPVFNGGERVEGYTNFLLVAFAAISIRCGLEPVFATKVLSSAALIWVLYLVTRLVRLDRTLAGRAMRLVPWVLLAPLHAFAYWAVVPMETMLFTALVVTAVWLVASGREFWRLAGSALVCALLAMTRPEGVLLFGLVFGAFAGVGWLGRSGTRRAGSWVLAAVFFLVPFAIFFVWRFGYYGFPFPNTFYAKVEGESAEWLHGLIGWWRWVLAHPILALAIPGGLFTGWRRVRERGEHDGGQRPPLAELAAICFGWVVYAVFIGGDDMPLFRFFLPILPLLAVLATWLLRSWVPADRKFVRAVAAIGLVTVVCSFLSYDPDAVFSGDRLTVVGERVGRWLAESQGDDTLVALNTAGAIPYYSRLPTLDMLGLTDRVIAHHSFYDAEAATGHRRAHASYVLERRPQVIVWYNSAGSFEPTFPSDRQLAEHPRFRFFYRPRVVGLRYGPSEDRWAYPLRSFLGYPWGRQGGQETWATNYGLYARYQGWPIPRTELFEGPVIFRFFEFDAQLARYWPSRWPPKEDVEDDIESFLGPAIDEWRGESEATSASSDSPCHQAMSRWLEGDLDGVRREFGRTADTDLDESPVDEWLCRSVRAAISGRPWEAISDQIRAVRLAPTDPIALAGLRYLLGAPYAELATPRARR